MEVDDDDEVAEGFTTPSQRRKGVKRQAAMMQLTNSPRGRSQKKAKGRGRGVQRQPDPLGTKPAASFSGLYRLGGPATSRGERATSLGNAATILRELVARHNTLSCMRQVSSPCAAGDTERPGYFNRAIHLRRRWVGTEPGPYGASTNKNKHTTGSRYF